MPNLRKMSRREARLTLLNSRETVTTLRARTLWTIRPGCAIREARHGDKYSIGIFDLSRVEDLHTGLV